jgi:type II secretory pathway component PulM
MSDPTQSPSGQSPPGQSPPGRSPSSKPSTAPVGPKRSLSTKLSDSYSGLTDREQKLVLAMGVIVPLVVITLVVGLFVRSLDDIESQTNSYENALELVAAGGPNFVKQQGQSNDADSLAAQFTEDVLTNNDVKLTSFIASKASSAGIKVSSYDSEEIPIGSASGDKSGPLVIEKRVKIDIRDAKHDAFLTFLEEIESSNEPVVIKRIDLRAKSRTPGEVRARVEVSTFVKKKQKS